MLADHLDDVIGIMSIDAEGKFTCVNQKAREILLDLSNRNRLPRNLIGVSIEEVLKKRLDQTVIGRTLLTGDEVQGQLVAYGRHYCIVTTRLIRNKESQITGCTQYIFETNAPGSEDDFHVSQSFTRSLADKLGYTSTDWIDTISLEHSQQLIRCLCATDHTVPITDYCPHKFRCAFNPRYGWDSLDRRNYLRVPIDLAVEISLIELPDSQTVPPDTQEVPIPGTTFDLSPRGTGLLCPVKLPLNSIISIDFHSTDKPFSCRGEVVWQRQDDDGNWLTGVSFQSVKPETSAAIIHLINRQQLRLWGEAAPRRRPVSDVDFDQPDVKYSIATLRSLLRAKSDDLFRHSLRVASYAKPLGTAMNMTDKQLMLLNHAALLHDLGWLELDLSLLRKVDSLTQEEREQMLLHCTYGAELIEAIPALQALAPIILHHHEHYDGSGYPHQLKEQQIPLLSRIIRVADSVDHMLHPLTSDREMSPDQVINVLSQEAGRKYDPTAAGLCIELIKSGELMSAV